jgi:hypothetical protein
MGSDVAVSTASAIKPVFYVCFSGSSFGKVLFNFRAGRFGLERLVSCGSLSAEKT